MRNGLPGERLIFCHCIGKRLGATGKSTSYRISKAEFSAKLGRVPDKRVNRRIGYSNSPNVGKLCHVSPGNRVQSRSRSSPKQDVPFQLSGQCEPHKTIPRFLYMISEHSHCCTPATPYLRARATRTILLGIACARRPLAIYRLLVRSPHSSASLREPTSALRTADTPMHVTGQPDTNDVASKPLITQPLVRWRELAL